MNTELTLAFKQLRFRWKAKHLNHIAEGIILKNRNVSFLAINALFRKKDKLLTTSDFPFKNSYILSGYVELQANDQLRRKAEILQVVFQIDKHANIIVITAYSENDEL